MNGDGLVRLGLHGLGGVGRPAALAPVDLVPGRADLAVLEVVVEQHGLLAADADVLRVLRGQPLVLGVTRVCQKNK